MNKDYIIFTSEDLAKITSIKHETLEDLLEKAKERRKEFYQELQHMDHLFNSLHNYLSNEIVKQLLRARGKRLPKDFQGIGLEGMTFGFDSPEVERGFAPKPIYLSQTEINRRAGAGYGRVLGLYDPNADQIYLVDTLTPPEEKEVYFHENVHRQHRDWSEGQVRNYVRAQGYTIFH